MTPDAQTCLDAGCDACAAVPTDWKGLLEMDGCTSNGPVPVKTPPAENDNAGGRVLIVEDDRDTRVLARTFLAQAGYEVAEAVDGLDALDKIRCAMPDVVVMDVMMPNMDGLEATRRLKADPSTRDIPIIIASALDEEADVIEAFGAGATEYITKPIRRREFVARIHSMVHLSRNRLELLRTSQERSERATRLQLLLDFSRSLAATRNLDTVLDQTISATAGLTHCRRISIMLPDADGKVLRIAKAIGLDELVASGATVPIDGDTAGRVFSTGQPVVINAPEEMTNYNRRYESPFFASIPLVCKAMSSSGCVVGVLNITERENRQPFELNELEHIDIIANTSAWAIDDILSHQARDEARDSIVTAMASLAEYRDNDTGQHLERVMRFSRILARNLQTTGRPQDILQEQFLYDLERAVPLHDIGKVAIPDRILLKPGKLTFDEMIDMRKHAQIGADIIRSISARVPGVSFLAMAQDIAWGHHEWYDGSGYPRRLRGCDIPLSARIAAVADVYDVLTTKRVYKGSVPHEKAVAIVLEGSGSQFDPVVVEAFWNSRNEFATVAAALAEAAGIAELTTILSA